MFLRALEDTDSEVRGRAAFYLDEIKRSRQAADDVLDLGELNMEEVDYIEAFLQVFKKIDLGFERNFRKILKKFKEQKIQVF